MRLRRKHFRRIGIDIAGFGLIILSPFAGLLPGPGGLPVFIAGLGILALNYDWAKRLVDNFEQKYNDFVQKHLVNNKKVSRTVDLLSLIILFTGLFTLLNAELRFFQVMGLGLTSFSIFVIISNQDRFRRLYKFIIKKLKR